MSKDRLGKPFKFTKAWDDYNRRRKGQIRSQVGEKISEAKKLKGPSKKHLENVSKKVINLLTKEIYESAKYIVDNNLVSMKIHSFRSRLRGQVNNETNYRYLQNN